MSSSQALIILPWLSQTRGCPLDERSPTFVVPGTDLIEVNFSMDSGCGGWFQDDSRTLRLLCNCCLFISNLMLLLI